MSPHISLGITGLKLQTRCASSFPSIIHLQTAGPVTCVLQLVPERSQNNAYYRAELARNVLPLTDGDVVIIITIKK